MASSTGFLIVAALMLVPLGGCSGEDQAEFIVCESTYALCTTAQCQPVAGKDDTAACDCDVETGYSAGASDAKARSKPPRGPRSDRAITRSRAMRRATTIGLGPGASTCPA